VARPAAAYLHVHPSQGQSFRARPLQAPRGGRTPPVNAQVCQVPRAAVLARPLSSSR
jgi:hypothetical protein